jgi:pimeloyl-ACP methyl ester carboxylesterase
VTAARYEVGRGEPVVLVHGLGDDHRAWRRVVAPLMLTRRVVLYDLRGHGGSPLGDDADGSLAQLGSDLIAVLDDAGIERATIAGFSLGGTIAMRAAIDAPDRVSALALIGTSSRVNSAARGWYEERAALVQNDDPELRATLDKDTEDVYRNRPRRSRPGCASAANRRKIRAASPTPAWRWRASTRPRSTPSSAPSSSRP